MSTSEAFPETAWVTLTRGISTLLVILLIPALSFAQGKRRAVVVGVAGFEHGYVGLEYTARGARRVASALDDLDYSASLLCPESSLRCG